MKLNANSTRTRTSHLCVRVPSMPLKRTRSLTDELINGAGIFRVRQKFSGDEALCNALRCRTRKDAGRERLSLGDCCRVPDEKTVRLSSRRSCPCRTSYLFFYKNDLLSFTDECCPPGTRARLRRCTAASRDQLRS